MIAQGVTVNGVRVRAGVQDGGLLHTTLMRMGRASPLNFCFRVGALDSRLNQHLRWSVPEIAVGDEVAIEVAEGDELDTPTVDDSLRGMPTTEFLRRIAGAVATGLRGDPRTLFAEFAALSRHFVDQLRRDATARRARHLTGFAVSVNGAAICTAADRASGVVVVSVTSRDRANLGREDLLQVFGIDSGTDRFQRWVERGLNVGDQVAIRVVETATSDPPMSREPHRSALTKVAARIRSKVGPSGRR